MNQKGFIPMFVLVGIVILGLIGGVYYLGITKNNKLEQVRQTIFHDEKTNSNKIFYVLFHHGTFSNYELNRNRDLLNDDYSEIYSYDLVTKQTSLVFSDKNEEFEMNDPSYVNGYKARVGNSKIFYKATKRKSDLLANMKGEFFLDLNTGKSSLDSTLANIDLLSSAMNGRLLAYAARGDTQRTYIEMRDTTTGETKQIIDLKNETDPNLFIEGLSLSPDGNHIAVETGHGFPPDAWDELIVVDVATGQVTKLIKKGQLQLINTMKPIWTDNSHLIFAAVKDSGHQYISGVYTMDIEGNNLQNVYTFNKTQCDSICDMMLDQTGTAVYSVESIDEAEKNKPRDQLVTKNKILRTDLKTGQTETLKEISIPTTGGSLSPFFIY